MEINTECDVKVIKKEPNDYNTQEVKSEKNWEESDLLEPFINDCSDFNINQEFVKIEPCESIEILNVKPEPSYYININCKEEITENKPNDCKKIKTESEDKEICDTLYVDVREFCKNSNADVKIDITDESMQLSKHNASEFNKNYNEKQRNVAPKGSCQDDLQKQRKKKSSSKMLKCNICSYETKFKYCLNTHKDSVHNEPRKKLKCQFCDKYLATKRTLDDHLLKQHKEKIDLVTSDIYKCSDCSYQTIIKSSLVRHIDAIHNEGRIKISCQFCDRSFAGKTALDDHFLKQHKEKICPVKSKIHKCNICQYQTTNKSNLKKHFNVFHNEHRKKINCQFCNKSFSAQYSLDDHLLKQHKQEIKSNADLVTSKIHTCQICSFQSTNKGGLNNHMYSVHNKERMGIKVKCEFCDKSFIRKGLLNKHLLTQHEQEMEKDNKDLIKSKMSTCNIKAEKVEVNCQFCDKIFASKPSLDNHLLHHHEKDIKIELITSKIHTCQLCSYKTTFKGSLNIHKNSVHNPQKINCMFCDKSFASKHTLDHHLLKQHKQFINDDIKSFITSKIYRCNMCSYKTTQKGNLKHHITLVHNKPTRIKTDCLFCNKSFFIKRALDEHLLIVHQKEIKNNLGDIIISKILKCENCDYETTFKQKLNKHKCKSMIVQ